jgi:hypothetical protein
MLCPLSLFSQTDTMDNKYYKIFIEDQEKEVKQLWKMNLIGFNVLSPNCGLELKLGKKWSSDTYAKLGSDIEFQSDTDVIIGSKSFLVMELSQQIKYYFNLQRREKLGKKTNGFTGNYFSLFFFAKINEYDYKELIETRKAYASADIFLYGAGLTYGLQRRIGNIGYFEVFAGMKYLFKEVPEKITETKNTVDGKDFYKYDIKKSTSQTLVPTIGIKAGFAIDSHANFKRMFK